MLVSVNIAFLMIIALSITAIGTPSSPILMLWIDTQYKYCTFFVHSPPGPQDKRVWALPVDRWANG